MKYSSNQYIVPESLYWKGVLHNLSQSRTALQPIFEAFTNAIEAIKIRQQSEPTHKGKIIVRIDVVETTTNDSFIFDGLTIIDDGIGFDDEQFKRFNTFKDITKGFKNLGSGRIQYVHYFDNTNIKSIFCQNGQYYKRNFTVSKKIAYLEKNSIVLHKSCEEVNENETTTSISFRGLLENSVIYNKLNEKELKEQLIKRYIHYFCHNRNNIPEINIIFFVQGELKGETTIDQTDFPTIDKTEIINVQYSNISIDGKSIEKLEKSEEFRIDSFKIYSSFIDSNDLKLISKGEIVEESEIKLESIPKGENVKGYRYIFLISSDYIDDRDTDMRGIINIPKMDTFAKSRNLFTDEEIILEDIQEAVNGKIDAMYPEIEVVKNNQALELKKLKEMFLLDDETFESIKLSVNDTEGKVLQKIYEAEAKKTAALDASIKESVDRLEFLDTTKPSYQEDLKKAVDELVKTIPIQNKRALTHYVARRKLVLELFQKILDNEAAKVNNGGRIDEDVLHNLIFQQTSSDPMNSDLWLVNEEYIYFRGVSEGILGRIELDGIRIIKDTLTEEEEEYRKKQRGDARLKRTDILLFPAEAKCIIIELKAPDQIISEHLNQINRYASLINNLSTDQFRFNTFYGYLIGESIDADDIIDNDSDFINAPNLGYIFRPFKRINGKFGRSNGSLYTEIIKYSTLLERAKLRNKIFIDKLK